MNRENFYLLLELTFSPPENDTGKITAAINKKQAEWAKLRNHPTKARQAQLYLEMLPDIKAVMTDDAKRGEEAKEANKIWNQKEKEKFKELDEAIKILSPKGQITEDEVNKLSLKFSIPGDAIRKRIRVPIVKAKAKKSTAKRLEASVQKKISDSLNIIGKKTLYEFLELSPTSSVNTLISKSKEKDTELKKDSRKDACLTASMELVGHCLNVFGSEEYRKMYDASLAYQRLDELNKAIDIAGLDKTIDVEEFDTLMTKARELGLNLDEAEEHIADYCAKKKWKLRCPTKPSVAAMKQCGNCGVMNTGDSKNCFKCGFPLVVACPKCKHKNPSTNINCSKCGFPIGDMPNALPIIKDAQIAKTDGEFKKAATLFRQALLFWPEHPEILTTLQEIENREKETARLAQELNDHVNQQKYFGARQLLFKLKQLDNDHPLLSLESRVTNRIKAAESWVKKARASGKEDEVMENFNHALQECSDCKEAADGMAKFPPEPPGKVEAVPSSHSMSLQWDKSSSKGTISYRIVKKTGSPPINALDGENLGETPQTLFHDTEAEPGRLFYYGIYSIRGQVYSTSGVIAGPVILTADIKDLCITPGDSVINLNWKTPANVNRIEVTIKPGGPPTSRRDGQLLEGGRTDGVTAAGLANGQIYGFLISSVFKNEKAGDIYSAGITCQCRPTAPPDPVKDISATKKGNEMVVTWTSPQKGNVQLYYSRQPFSISPGEIISTSRLSTLGMSIPVQSPGRVRVPIKFQGSVYFLPVTVDGGLAVVGSPGMTTSIDDVSHLKGYINSGRLYLEWEWPAGAQQVVILYNNTGFSKSPDDNIAVKKVFSRNQYLRNSAFIIHSIEAKDYYFTVFVAASRGEKEEKPLYSTGREYLIANSGHMELYYDIRLEKNFIGKTRAAELRLFTRDNSFKMPEAVLVKKRQNLPLRKTDGIPILDIQPMEIFATPAVIKIPSKEIGKGAYVKLFFADDTQSQRFRIMSPAKAKLQIG